MAVQIPIILAFIARQGLQAAMKKYGRSAVSKATSQAAREATKKTVKRKNKDVLKQLDKKDIEDKAAENILRRQIEKEGVDKFANVGRDAAKKAVKKPSPKRPPYTEVGIAGAVVAPSLLQDKEEREFFQEGGKANKGIEALRKEAPEVVARMGYEEGGDVDSQMAMLMPEEEMMSEEEMMETPMVPDEEMEDDYLDFVVSQALEPEEQELLMDILDESPQLSVIFDKLMDVATEFSGAGPVNGPGSEVSDSIPARLSDGEFVMTAKATEQLGADRLQSMMEDAESEADVVRQQNAEGGEIEETKVDRFGKPVDEDIAEDEIKKGMMSVNPRMQ